jgi:hypothetical protein
MQPIRLTVHGSEGKIERRKCIERGWGAFARAPLLDGTYLGKYEGRTLDITSGELWVEDCRVQNDGEYSITLGNGSVVDGGSAEYEGTLGRNLNHTFFPNAKVECDGDIVTIADVGRGEEITIDYGPHFRYVGFEWIDIDWSRVEAMGPGEFFRTDKPVLAERRYVKLMSALGSMGMRERRVLCDIKWAEYNKH